MNQSVYYTWDETTKKYLDTVESQIDPLESATAEEPVYCGLPINGTYIEPLEHKDGFDVVWAGENWEYQEIPQPQPAPEPTEEERKQQRIAQLKIQLNSTDYKIIKCSECSLVGEELPYNIAELHAQRQALRDEINELEQ